MSDRIKVVLDVGGQWTRAGFAGESFPRAEYPSVVGRFRRTELLDGFPDVYCGREAVLKRGISLLSWPMQKGLIQDWDELEKLLHHTFYKELLVAPEETNVMYALHPLTPGKDKEQMAELLFETFIVDAIYLAQSPALVTLASGRTTGLVWENGYSCCYTAPVFEGFPLKHSIVTSQLTGQAITGILLDLMKNIGYSFTTPTEIELAEKIKASTCYVATDLKSIQASRMADGDTKVRYQLPDGQHIILDEERFICPEVFFRPSLQGLECPSIVDDICKTISRCDIDYQPMFYDNIVLSGGGSQLAGLDKRLHRELLLRVLEQPNFRVTVDAMESRQHATWRGGSMLACMDAVKGCYLTKEEYEDSGTGRTQSSDKEMAFEKPPVIIDTGSYTIKAGFACDNHPVAIFRTAVGRPSYLNGSYGKEPYDVYVGNEATEQGEDLEISYPVVKGRIVHWDNIERILHHILYRELKVAPEDRAIMLSLAASTPMSEKFRCCEIIFETLNCIGLCIQSQGVLTMYGSGYTTGICVDMGYDKVDISPVYEGGLIAYAQTTTGIPSLGLHDYVRRLLEERNINITSQRVLRDLKKNAYITRNAAFNRKTGTKTFTLPDGEVIDISNEAFMAGEVLFQPELAAPDWDVLSIPKAVQKAAEMCDPDLRSELLDGVVPCGGMSMIPGLCPRLKQDLEVLTNEVVNVYSSDEAYALSWLGGATFAGMPDPKIWVTKRQYEDFGEKIVKNKFT